MCVSNNLFSQYISPTQQIPQDKQRHFAVSVAINSMVYITAYDYYYQKNPLTAHSKALTASNTISISLGVLKELYDYTLLKQQGLWTDKTRQDMYTDMLANIFGNITISVVIDTVR